MTTTYKVNNDNGEPMLLLQLASGKLDTKSKRAARRLSVGTHPDQLDSVATGWIGHPDGFQQRVVPDGTVKFFDGIELAPCVVCGVTTSVAGLKGSALEDRDDIPTATVGKRTVDSMQRLATAPNGDRAWLRIASGEADRVLDDHTPLASWLPDYERVQVEQGPGGAYTYSTIANVCTVCNGTTRNASMAPAARNDIRALAGIVRAVSCIATVSEGGGLPDNARSTPTVNFTVLDRPSLQAFVSRVIPMYRGYVPPYVQRWVKAPFTV